MAYSFSRSSLSRSSLSKSSLSKMASVYVVLLPVPLVMAWADAASRSPASYFAMISLTGSSLTAGITKGYLFTSSRHDPPASEGQYGRALPVTS